MTKIETGTIHKIPADLKKVIIGSVELAEKWNSLTPLARNEWICYVTIPKQEETKQKRITRLESDLIKGKKRPCCWPGCPHHRPNAKKWFK
jgi:uncharacterized protein YdeI (YjbR/CyaY-like superfamily)